MSEFQRGVLALRKRKIIASRRAAAAAVVAARAEASQAPEAQAPWEGDTDPVVAQALASVPKVPDDALDTRLPGARRTPHGQPGEVIRDHPHQNAARGGGCREVG